MDDIQARLMAIFVDEIDERINAFDHDLLALEARPDESERTEIVRNLFRCAHSLKGAASSVGATSIERVCHALEDILAALRDGRLELDEARFELLFQTADSLREMGRRIRAGDAPLDLEALANHLASAASGTPLDVEHGAEAPARYSAAAESTVRVASDKLDELLLQSGELLVAQHHASRRLRDFTTLGEMARQLRTDPVFLERKSTKLRQVGVRVRDLERAVERLASKTAADHAALEQAARRVDADIRRIRMLPFAGVCAGLERIVRDAGRASGKEVRLDASGGDIELDRSILEGLRDPLGHLVRNAVDHGIEPGDARRASGKSAVGTISVTAAVRGSGVEIVVADDGAGIDFEAVQKRAHERGFAVGDLDLTSALFLPGVSTASSVTGLSGRGVGLDAVQTALRAMRGTVSVTSVPGVETRFAMTLPLTLTTLRVLLFEAAGETFAIDSSVVARVARVAPAAVLSVEGRPVIADGDQLLSIVPFTAIFDLIPQNAGGDAAAQTIMIVGRGDRQIAIRVDALIEEREVVVRSLGQRLSAVRSTSGATTLEDGAIAPIVRTEFVLERAAGLTRTQRSAAPKAPPRPAKRILLVDDSATTRTLERSILEAAEYHVLTAGDGEDAWAVLNSNDVDLVVSDVDMPRMDGFALVEFIRASVRFRGLPVVLVTARESEEDKLRGLEVGADAYVLKSGFDQKVLLETISQLL
jgi:two-component system, chemotaxis family, sensor kinase CheA